MVAQHSVAWSHHYMHWGLGGRDWLLPWPPARLAGRLPVPTALPRASPTALGRAPAPSPAPGGVSAPLRALLGLQSSRDRGLRRPPARPPLRHQTGARINEPRSFGDQGLTPIGRGHVTLPYPAKARSVRKECAKKWRCFFLKKKRKK